MKKIFIVVAAISVMIFLVNRCGCEKKEKLAKKDQTIITLGIAGTLEKAVFSPKAIPAQEGKKLFIKVQKGAISQETKIWGSRILDPADVITVQAPGGMPMHLAKNAWTAVDIKETGHLVFGLDYPSALSRFRTVILQKDKKGREGFILSEMILEYTDQQKDAQAPRKLSRIKGPLGVILSSDVEEKQTPQ